MVNCILWGDFTDWRRQVSPEASGPFAVTHSLVRGGYPGQGNLGADAALRRRRHDPHGGVVRLVVLECPWQTVP